MTDTTTPAPTDEDLVLEARKIGGLFDDLAVNYQFDDIVRLARAVLAKWGAPAPASGELVAEVMFDERKYIQYTIPLELLPVGTKFYTAQEARDGCTLSSRIAELTEQHGSLRAAARSLDFDPGYLARLRSGEKFSPSPALLERHWASPSEAQGEGEGCNSGTPVGDEPCTISGLREQLKRLSQEARLNPDMPTQELRLHMGELTTDEVLVARAAIRWANSQQEARVPLSDDQIDAIRFTRTKLPQAPTGRDDFVNIVRLIESHHGITAARKDEKS